MLRLRSYLLSTVRVASPLATASSSFHRLLLYSTTTTSPARFVPEEFLVTTCGLTPAQALKTSKYLAHLKSPSKPEAALAFLKDIGATKADVAAAIALDSRILVCSVDKTLRSRFGMLRDIGLSPPQISKFIPLLPRIRSPANIRRLEFYLSFLGSYDKVLVAIKRNPFLLNRDIERVVKPNIAFLQQCGMKHCDIVKTFRLTASLLVRVETQRLKEIVACADKLGVPRDSGMFNHALVSLHISSPEKVDSRLDFLQEALGCSEAEARKAVCKFPYILTCSEDRINRSLHFLMMEVGLESNYILNKPALVSYSLTRRLVPRHFVLEALKAKGLLKKDVEFNSMASRSDKVFIKRFIDPYKESVPRLADAYAAACAGQVPGSACLTC